MKSSLFDDQEIEKIENEIGTLLLDAAFFIHRELGPGLFENVYEVVLAHMLLKKGLDVQRQVAVPIEFQGMTFNEGFRADIIVENKLIVEIKSVSQIAPVHRKQLLPYLTLKELRLGYILNFGAQLMKNGIARVVRNL